MAGRTAGELRAGTAVQDRWDGRWVVRSYRAPARPAEPLPGAASALARLLTPWASGQGDGARPDASWVMGRSARWQGPDAPGTDDPTRAAVLGLRAQVAMLGTGGRPSLLVAVGLCWRAATALRGALDERTRPWLVELVAVEGPQRIATWQAPGPEAAQAAAAAVRDAVRAWRVPAPAGARLVEVRDSRPPAGR